MHFHHSRGGFAVSQATYVLVPTGRPVVPDLDEILRTAEGNPQHKHKTDAELLAWAEQHHAKLVAGLPAAEHAYALAPWQVRVFIAGQEVASLRYEDALRFLRTMGVILRCDRCGTEQHIVDYWQGEDVIVVCPTCRTKGEAYRAA